MPIRSFRLAVALRISCAALLLSGCCSVFFPYVSVNGSESPDAKTQPMPLDKATQYAADLRAAYYKAANEHSLFTKGAGVLLIGAAAAALAIGINGGSSDAIAGLGAGAAGVLGIHQLFYSASRPRAYIEGGKAITCALTLFAGLRSADTKELNDLLTTFPQDLDALAAALDRLSAAARTDVDVKAAQNVLDEGRVTLSRGKQAAGVANSAGVRLYDAVEGIRAQVNLALVASEPDVAQIAAGLGKSLPAYYAALTPALQKPAATGTSSKLTDLEKPLVAAVLALSAKVAATAQRIEAIVAQIGELPSREQLASCNIDAAGSGITFRLDPSGTVSIDTTAEHPQGVVIASGGKAPYHAQWISDVPGDGSGVTLDPVDHDRGGKGQGVVTVKATKAAPAHTYQLLVSDEGAGHGTVWVVVGNAPVSAAAPPPAKKPTEKPATKPADTPATKPAEESEETKAIKAMQKRLVDLGCLGKNGATGVIDAGTEAALKALLVAEGQRASDYDTAFVEAGKFSLALANENIGKAEAPPASVKCPSAAAPP
jgi:hypothetical protein